MTASRAKRAQGKVRDIYDAGDAALLLVASDRISAFDVVLPNPIPDKGRVLTGLSSFWFERTRDLVANHVITATRSEFPAPFDGDPELAGRAMLVRRAEVIPIECVARGYLSGSGWVQYRRSGSVCGIALPPGIAEAEQLPEPIFTPTTKAAAGHDEPLTAQEAADRIGRGLSERLKELTLEIYERAASVSLERGIILADTKLEFGFCEGELILIDEACTPDSSRLWPADAYEPGRAQPSLDKQPVRDWLDASGWDHEPPPPVLPAEVVARTTAAYVDAYERLTGEPFDGYLGRMGAPGPAGRDAPAADGVAGNR
ncbi:MAG: phosphoribosylaminoimidazolesuccinocarboxamide synthase [Actinomycetota bacterium]|nr:phosphoribosylaminoimidazolesuccinocarboxamide synthase [Actinomycetota bacterium]